MLILRIRQAECALADGRLDEAFDLVTTPAMREHKRGQDLAGRLARRLVERGKGHLDGSRLTQAGADCEKAAKLGGKLPEIEELRGAVAAALMSRQQAERRQAEQLAAAREQIKQGHLSVCEKILEDVEEKDGGGGGAVTLLMDVAARRAVIDSVLAKAAEALKRDDWEAAVEELATARRTHAGDSRVRELVGQATKSIVKKIEGAIGHGRLDLAASLLRRLDRVADGSLETEHLHKTLGQCRLAWALIERGQARRAEEIVRRLAAVLPDADWIEAALTNLKGAGDAMEQLRAGPFALLDGTAGGGAAVSEQQDVQKRAAHAAPARVLPAQAGDALPKKLLLQVDGVGSFLVLRGPRVSIGPTSAGQAVDVAMMADSSAPVVFVERMEEDYFLRSGTPVAVNDRPTKGKLLATGDRIALSPRCRMSYRRPSAASASAVIDLHSARLARADVRTLVLMDREIIIGASSGSHVRCEEAGEAIVVCVRDGRIVVQSRTPVMVEGAVVEDGEIALGRHVQVGAVSFVVTGA